MVVFTYFVGKISSTSPHPHATYCSVCGTIQPHLPRMSRVLLTARMTCMNAMPTYVYSPETATMGWQLHHDAFIFWHVDYSRPNWKNRAKMRNPQNPSLGTQVSPPALLCHQLRRSGRQSTSKGRVRLTLLRILGFDVIACRKGAGTP